MASFDSLKRILSGKRVPQIFHQNVSIGQVILYEIHKNPNKVLQVNDDDGIELTGGQIASMMINIAKNLYRFGLRSGDVVGLCASNSTYIAPVILGCLLLKLPINPVDKFFDVGEIVTIFDKTNPKIIFCDHDNVGKVIEVLQSLRNNALVIILTEKVRGILHISELLVDYDIFLDDIIYQNTNRDMPAYIVCTSGSTGRSKLALISHMQQLQFYSWFEDYAENRFSYCASSMFWLNGLSNVTYRTLNTQKRLITAKPFSPDLFFDFIEKYNINECNLFTPLLKLIIESPRFESADFSNFDMIVTGGVAVPEYFRQIFLSKLTNGKLVIGYGLSEVGGISSKTVTSPISMTIGVPCINTEIKIQLDDGSTGFVKEIGEILVRHPVRFLGYFNNEPRARIDDEGWYHTGDMGFIDDNHELNIVGQRSQAIKNIHNEIYPFDIENRIENIEGVIRVVVVGTPDLMEFEVATALIVKDPASNITEETIRAALTDLPHYQQLTGGIFFVENFPLTNLGKVKRNEAKEMATTMKIERQLFEL